MKVKSAKEWEVRKSALLEGIDTALIKETVDKEVLEIMKELISSTKVRNTMEEYYEDKEN